MSDDLRRALTGLSTRERRAMREQATAAAEKWSAMLPRVAVVWEAFGAELADVEELARAREASGPAGGYVPHMRYART